MRREAVYCERCGAYIPETTGVCVACGNRKSENSPVRVYNGIAIFQTASDFTPIEGYKFYYELDTRLCYQYCDDGIFRVI